MDVLISWSKNKSKQLALGFKKWLPTVLPGGNFWMSEKDIEKGTEWFSELQTFLGQAKHCIIIVTEENVGSPWLYYEAGTIAAKGPGVRICPYLIGVKPAALTDGPLGKWMCTEPTADETLSLVHSLNKQLPTPHHQHLLETTFEAKWPNFEAELNRVIALPSQHVAATVHLNDDFFNTLSSEAKVVLIETSQDSQGHLMYDDSDMSGEWTIQTNGKLLCEQQDPRSKAAWTQALDNLLEAKLLRRDGAAYAITAQGYSVAENLRLTIKAAPTSNLDDNDIITMLEGYLSQRRMLNSAFRFDDMENELGLPSGVAKPHIEKAAAALGYVVKRKGNTTVTFGQVLDGPTVTNFDGSGRPRRY